MIYVSHLLNDEEMKELIQTTHMGVESIEFSIAENLDHLPQTLHSYEKRLADLGYPNLILHGPFLDLNPMSYDSLVTESTRKRYDQAYEAAQALGAKKIVFHTCFMPASCFLTGWAQRVADFYCRFLAEKDDSIEILMENVLDPFPDPLAKAAEAIQHPAFGICLDVGHAHCYSDAPISQWSETLLPWIRHFHLHDNQGDRDSHLALGDGSLFLEQETLFQKYIRQLLSQKNLTFTIECNSVKDVKRSCAYLQKLLS